MARDLDNDEWMEPVETPDDERVQGAAKVFRILGDATRSKIRWALLQHESSVARLADVVGAAPTAVSQHLTKLRSSGLVRVRREGTFGYYSAVDGHVRHLLLETLLHSKPNELTAAQTGAPEDDANVA